MGKRCYGNVLTDLQAITLTGLTHQGGDGFLYAQGQSSTISHLELAIAQEAISTQQRTEEEWINSTDGSSFIQVSTAPGF